MLYILIAAAILEACTFAYARIEHGGKISAQADAKAARLELSEYTAAQRAHISRLVNEGVQAAAAADLKAKEFDNARKEAVSKYANLARSLPARRNPVDVSTVRLLNDAIAASSRQVLASTPGEPVKDPTPATSDTGDWVDWSLTAIDAYAACRDQVTEFQGFYNDLRAKQEDAPKVAKAKPLPSVDVMARAFYERVAARQ